MSFLYKSPITDPCSFELLAARFDDVGLNSSYPFVSLSQDQIENSMEQVRQEFEREWENKEAQMELEDQQIRLDRQLIRVRSHLAQGTKVRH